MDLKKTWIVVAITVIVFASSISIVLSTDDSDADTVTFTKDGLVYTLTDKGSDDANAAEITDVDGIGKNKGKTIPSNLIISKYVEYEGAKYHLTAINVNIPSYLGNFKAVEIESNPGLVIKSGLFQNNYITSAVIGEGIELSEKMFNGCSRLRTVTLPSSLSMIPAGVFGACSSLSSVNLGEKVISIGDGAFSGCKALTELNLPESLQSIGNNAFNNCSSIAEFHIGTNVKSIGTGAFFGTQLKTLAISANLTEIGIGPNCFLDDLDSISIPEENPAYTVDNGVLYNKDKSVLLYYPRSVTTADGTFTTSASIGPYAFYQTLLKKITILDGAKSIGEYAFSNCRYLTEVSLADSIENIGTCAFEFNLSKASSPLESVTLSSGITEIAEKTFQKCSSIKDIIIPKNVVSIGNYAFNECTNLKSVKVLGNLRSIGDSAFMYCSNLTELNLPDSLVSVGLAAFSHASAFRIDALPNSIETIDSSAFAYCTNLKITKLPRNLSSLGSLAFYDSGIEMITVGESTPIKLGSDNVSKLHIFGGSSLKSICLDNVIITNLISCGTVVAPSENLASYALGPNFSYWTWDENGIGLNKELKTAYTVKPSVKQFTIPLSIDKLTGAGFQGTQISEVTFEGDSSRTISFEINKNDYGIFINCSDIKKVVLPHIILGAATDLDLRGCVSLTELEIYEIKELPQLSQGKHIISKITLHNCESISSWPNAYCIQLPDNLSSMPVSNRLYDSDGTKISKNSADVVSDIKGKLFVWKGNKTQYPDLIKVTESQSVVCLDYGDSQTYIAVDTGSVMDLTKYVRYGYTVDRWYSDVENTTEYVPSSVTGPFTVYAHVNQPIYTVKKVGTEPFVLSYNGEVITDSVQVSSGETVIINAESKVGYRWGVKGASSSTYWTRTSITVTKDLELSVIYSPCTVTLSFNTVGAETIPSIKGECGSTYERPADPVKTGYKFLGWSPELVGNTIPGGDNNSTLTFTAMWLPDTVKIVFDTAGGSTLEPLSRLYNTMYGSLSVPVKGGYSFAGWYMAEDSGEPVKYQDIIKTVDTVVLHAKWVINQHTVTYIADGVQVGDVEKYDYGTEVYLRNNVSKTGYSMVWRTEDTVISDGKFLIPDNDVVITAGFSINQYTISFDTAGGSEISPLKQDYGTSVNFSDTPVKTGYSFKGWSPSVPATVPAEDITVTAVWKVNQYTVTFDTNGGSSVSSITQDYDTVVPVPLSPNKVGYTFAGWNPRVPVTIPAEDITVTAVWKVNQYTVTFDTVGGSSIAPITQDYGTVITVLDVPVKDGFVFLKWVPEVPVTIPAENLSVSAVWAVLPSTNSDGRVSVDLTGGSDLFVVSDDVTALVVNMADNTYVKVKDASSLAGKAVTSKINSIVNVSDIDGTAYDFVFSSDSGEYNGLMAVTLPYSKEDGKQAVVYYWNGSETVTMNVIDQGKDYVTFETDHNSVYIVTSEDLDDGSDLLLAAAGIAIVIAAFIAVVLAVVYSRRKV